MVPICEFCHFDYIDRADHSACGPGTTSTEETR